MSTDAKIIRLPADLQLRVRQGMKETGRDLETIYRQLVADPAAYPARAGRASKIIALPAAAELTGLSAGSLQRLIDEGKLKSTKRSGAVCVWWSDCDAYVREHGRGGLLPGGHLPSAKSRPARRRG
jgi:predicted DNA-binding transcriptional regulator AlpA